MDFIWILFAFICGLAAKTINLPPSIGFLAAGFALHYLGYESDDTLKALSDLGITLMLFTIGLKLDIKTLFKTEIWLTSSLHTVVWIVIATAAMKIFAFIAISSFQALDLNTSLLIAFALSFSSTVCVIKLLEENGEMRTRHGKLAVAILIIQDIVAVGFLVIATAKMPLLWALALLSLFLVKPIIKKLISLVGHGELIPLMGFFFAFGSYELFELVNIKGDLGALLMGMFLASHGKASEINKSLMSFKDLFLIGFFLSIGFTATLSLEMIGLAGMLMLLIPIKFMLFFALLSVLKVRARTAFLSSLALSNFSEFGLIVAAVSVNAQWLNKEWLVILALAVAFSFVVTNVLYNYAHTFFTRYRNTLTKLERNERLSEDIFIQPSQAPIIIIGMGRVGMGAYNAIKTHGNKRVWALDADKDKVNWLTSQGIEAYYGDAEDVCFWENIDLTKLELVLIALPSVKDSISITTQLNKAHFSGKIAAIARFDDERIKLENQGIDKVFNFYNEVGVGFADESIALLKES